MRVLLAGLSAAYHDAIRACGTWEVGMAKGQMRTPKEKKKPKADKERPKQVSAYKQAQMAPTSAVTTQPKKT
jgi:hypothetical protein